ncbi:MAG: glycosyltransferase [Bacteroidota bacterium]|nr:glycosyltransferase [Bacteroidota bacterium]MDP4212528.1 glycosyltransferase [Bacteroidota bacterium]MDP4250514.1 glycosyltransferase [Bacteroidota bacterium]
MDFKFPDVTLLITHYNRSASLERLLLAFDHLSCSFGNIIVSDDASQASHLDKINALKNRFHFQLVSAGINKGLGHNLNQGQDAVRTEYTLYVQEDFIPLREFPEKLLFSLECLKTMDDLDMVRFYAYRKYPYLEPLANGFSRMMFGPFKRGYEKFYYYSDHPHLRRSSFFEKFGRYKEGVKSDVTEYRMMLSFLRHKGKALFYDDFKSLFDQHNPDDEPSTVKRSYLSRSDRWLIRNIRHLFRHVKFNYNYFKP